MLKYSPLKEKSLKIEPSSCVEFGELPFSARFHRFVSSRYLPTNVTSHLCFETNLVSQNRIANSLEVVCRNWFSVFIDTLETKLSPSEYAFKVLSKDSSCSASFSTTVFVSFTLINFTQKSINILLCERLCCNSSLSFGRGLLATEC